MSNIISIPADFLTNSKSFAKVYYDFVFFYTGKKYSVTEFDLNCNIAYEILTAIEDLNLEYLTNDYIIKWIKWYLKDCKQKGLIYDKNLYISSFKNSYEVFSNTCPNYINEMALQKEQEEWNNRTPAEQEIIAREDLARDRDFYPPEFIAFRKRWKENKPVKETNE